jgi:hypothetical protein
MPSSRDERSGAGGIAADHTVTERWLTSEHVRSTVAIRRIGDDEVLAMDSTIVAAIIGVIAAVAAVVIADILRRWRKLRPPIVVAAEEGPLTLGAVLKSPADVQRFPPAFPTGRVGAHFTFGLHNPNRVAFIVGRVEVEVLSYRPIEIEGLSHGVGAPETFRLFNAEIQPQVGRYEATYELPSKYIKVLAEGDEKFDVEVATGAEGLFELCVHVRGTLSGKRFNVSLKSRSIVFFDRHSDYQIERSPGSFQTFDEYIAQLLAMRSVPDPQLSAYQAVD